MTDAVVPGKPSSGAASSREIYRAQEAMLETLRVLPALSVLDVESWGHFPLTVPTKAKSVLGIVPIACFEVNNEGSTIAFGNVQWAHGDEPGEITIIGLGGLTAGTQYTIRLLVIGQGG